MAVKALVNFLADKLAEAAVEKPCDTLSDVENEALFTTLAAKLQDAEPEKLNHTLGDVGAEPLFDALATHTGRQRGYLECNATANTIDITLGGVKAEGLVVTLFYSLPEAKIRDNWCQNRRFGGKGTCQH